MIETRRRSKIEGGVDAIVLGATPDALAAAALMAKGGLGAVLIETGARPRDRREFAPGFYAEGGDPLASALDAEVIDALDLYRYGLSYARRRLETLVRFSDGAALVLPADPDLVGEAVGAMSEEDADAFAAFLDEERKTARSLAGWFAGDHGSPAAVASAASSVDGAVVGRFADVRLTDYLRAEATLGCAARPSEAFTRADLLRRLSGDAAGLQGGVAAIEGGGRGLAAALRRAGQAGGVAFRQTDRVKSVIVEGDRVAGVEFEDGGQLRASAIIAALPARESFLALIGRERLNLEFARMLDAATSPIASLRAHLAIMGPVAEPIVAARLDRRFLYAPSMHELNRAFRIADEGGAGAPTIAEIVFSSAIDAGLAPEGCSSATVLLHPVAYRPDVDERWLGEARKAATAVFAKVAPGAAAQVEAVELDAPEPAAPPAAVAVDRRRRLTDASGLEGFFFCGSEALLGGALTLTAGRRASERALRYFKETAL